MVFGVDSCGVADSFSMLSSPVEESPSLIMSFIRFAWHSVFCFFFTPLVPDLLAVPQQCPGYIASHIKSTTSGITADLHLAGEACNIYGNDLNHLRFKAEYQTESRVHVMVYDADEIVYQVPESVIPRPKGSVSEEDSLLSVEIVKDPFSFAVIRKDNNEAIFNTSGSSLIFEDQYLRLRTSLPSEPKLYGLGEHTDPMLLNTTDYTRTLWARDSDKVPPGLNLYGSHPVYFENRPASNSAHGVLLLNSNGMDVKINSTSNDGQYLEYNTIGGIVDLYFVAGPSPVEVAQQYSEIVGKPAMIPYWGFGYHQCRFGYQDVYELAEVVSNYSIANIPLETMWADIDYMDAYRVFTLDPVNFPLAKMRELVSFLHEHQQHYVVMVDPAVAYQNYDTYNRGAEVGAFLRNSNGSAYQAVVWPGPAVYPDWFHERTQEFWNKEFAIFFNSSGGLDIDALWIDMNEPSNFCLWPCDDPVGFTRDSGWIAAPPPPPRKDRPSIPGFPSDFQPESAIAVQTNELGPQQALLETDLSVHIPLRENMVGSKKGLPGRDLISPKYKIRNEAGSLSNHTASTDVIHSNGLAEYDTHNLFGLMMSSASRIAMLARRPTKRPLIVTRSTFIGAGRHVAHWLGDNGSTWEQYRATIRHMLQFTSIFQVPIVGADVCGFEENTTETLCARWATLGAFYPFYRNHNNKGDIGQEFYRWPLVAETARKAIDLRYRLLDYIYTALHRQSVDGTPVLSPLWFHYPQDLNTLGNQLQFFYGSSLLVSPVTEENITTVDIYLPDDKYYSFSTLSPVEAEGKYVHLTDIPYTDIPLHIRGGSIIPLRISGANTTTQLRKKDFELLIAPDAHGHAEGFLYLDDGESLEQTATSEVHFTYRENTLDVSGTFGYDVGSVKVAKVTVLGESPVAKVLDVALTGEVKVEIASLSEF